MAVSHRDQLQRISVCGHYIGFVGSAIVFKGCIHIENQWADVRVIRIDREGHGLCSVQMVLIFAFIVAAYKFGIMNLKRNKKPNGSMEWIQDKLLSNLLSPPTIFLKPTLQIAELHSNIAKTVSNKTDICWILVLTMFALLRLDKPIRWV